MFHVTGHIKILGYYHPLRWISIPPSPLRGDPKVHNFEILNFGKFQVSKWASGMKRLFKVSFKNTFVCFFSIIIKELAFCFSQFPALPRSVISTAFKLCAGCQKKWLYTSCVFFTDIRIFYKRTWNGNMGCFWVMTLLLVSKVLFCFWNQQKFHNSKRCHKIMKYPKVI